MNCKLQPVRVRVYSVILSACVWSVAATADSLQLSYPHATFGDNKKFISE